MAVDTPARIAILGAGPLGLEAALYARFLGYDIDVYERAEVAHNVLQWGHVRMVTPFALNSSSLARAAIAAQNAESGPTADSNQGLPAPDALLTGRQWVERYLLPLAHSDLLVDNIHTGRTVVAVGRQDLLKDELPGQLEREDSDFRLLTRDAAGRELVSYADIVIDASGVFGCANWMGPGGTPAVGERSLREQIEYGLPDVLGTERERYAGRHTLVVGNDYWAASTIVALAQLIRDVPATRVTWATRHAAQSSEDGDGHQGPIPCRPIPGWAADCWPQRDELAQQANRLATAGIEGLDHWPETVIETLERVDTDSGESDSSGPDLSGPDLSGPGLSGTGSGRAGGGSRSTDGESRFRVGVSGPRAGMYWFDQIVANVGYRPNVELYRELQVQACYASEGPIKLAATLRNQSLAEGALIDGALVDGPLVDGAGTSVACVEALMHPEPNFYVLGSKSFGRNGDFLMATGLEQIRQVFALIGDRANLNLYETAKKLPQ